jgi:hypothetical protein
VPVINPTDVATSLGRPLTSTEVDQVTMWIGDAELLIRSRLGDLNNLDQDLLKYVVRETVVLKLKQPDPVRKVEVSVDDGRISREYSGTGDGSLFISDAWWAMLTPDVEDGSGGAFTVNPFGKRWTC